ncbi:MAG: serine/threonine-protein kinase [Myxococcota bacterium]
MEYEKPLDNSSSTPLSAARRDLADGRYVLVRHVAEGGTAHVYLGYDTWTETWRAVKTLLPEYARRPALRHRFEREAATMKTLSHDNIIAVYDAGIEAETVFMVMEYAEGGSVIDWVERHGPMPPRMATTVVLELCAGIDAAHRQGVIHRDIKPQNLLVDRSGHCKVTDFGIAQVLEDTRMTMTGTVMGTMGYMAPEQNESAKHADERADVYSIAATYYTLIKGEAATHLFMAEDQDFDGIPGSLAEIIKKGSQYKREARFQTVRELMGELEGALRMLAPDPLDTPPIVPYDLPSIEDMTPPSVDASVGGSLGGSQSGVMLPAVRPPTSNTERELEHDVYESTHDEPSVPSYIDREWVIGVETSEQAMLDEREEVSDPHSLDQLPAEYEDELERVDLPDVRRTPITPTRHVGRGQAIQRGVAIALGTVVFMSTVVLGLMGLISANQISRKEADLARHREIILDTLADGGVGDNVVNTLPTEEAGRVQSQELLQKLADIRVAVSPLEQMALIRQIIDLIERKDGIADTCFRMYDDVGGNGRCKTIAQMGATLDEWLVRHDDVEFQRNELLDTLGGQVASTLGFVKTR